MKKNRFFSPGLSMIELLIVIAIVVILFIVLLLSLRTQVSRGRDAERKTDLENIKVAFEDYYNDNGCYPPADVLENCNAASFVPYLNSIPCDPVDGEPYLYVPLEGDTCLGYRVYTGLEAEDDPGIEAVGCDAPDFCGYGPDYNYGISSGVPIYDGDGISASPNPSPSPTGIIYVYACDNNGVCNEYEQGHPFLENCPVTFQSTDCSTACEDPANRCN